MVPSDPEGGPSRLGFLSCCSALSGGKTTPIHPLHDPPGKTQLHTNPTTGPTGFLTNPETGAVL